MVALKEQGMTDEAMAEYFTKQGKFISEATVNKRLTKYYASIGKAKPRGKTKMDDISIEEMVALKEQGMSDRKIAEYFTKQGETISYEAVNKKLTKYYESIGKAKPNAKPKLKRREKTKNRYTNRRNDKLKGKWNELQRNSRIFCKTRKGYFSSNSLSKIN